VKPCELEGKQKRFWRNVLSPNIRSPKLEAKYMLMSRNQKIGQMHNVKLEKRPFEDVAKFKYLGTILTDQNWVLEEIKGRLNSGNTCYHSVQSLLSSRLLSRNVRVKIYKTIILTVVLYGCETWSVILSEEHRLREFEKRVLRRILRSNKNEVTRKWRKLHIGGLHNLYSSPDIIRQMKARRMRWAGHVARMGEGRNVCRVLVGNPEGKRPLGRPRRRRKHAIRIDLREVGWGGVEWIRLAQDRDRWRAVVNAVINITVGAPRSLFVIYQNLWTYLLSFKENNNRELFTFLTSEVTGWTVPSKGVLRPSTAVKG
jgi:hypothetical protein